MKKLLASTLLVGLASFAMPMEALADTDCRLYGQFNASVISRTDSAPMCAWLVETNRHGTIWHIGTPLTDFFFRVYRGKDGDVISEYYDHRGRVSRRDYGYWSFYRSGWRAVFKNGRQLFVSAEF